MKVVVLSSGSKGNTTYIESNKAKILIDDGNTCKYIINKFEELNINPNELDARFLHQYLQFYMQYIYVVRVIQNY